MATRNIPAPEAAGMIQRNLEAVFPGTDFEVVAEGTNPKAMEVIVQWEGCPTVDEVQSVGNEYRSTDYCSGGAAPREVWLMPDGSIAGLAHRHGVRSGFDHYGNVLGGLGHVVTTKPHPDAEKVQFLGVSRLLYVWDGELYKMSLGGG